MVTALGKDEPSRDHRGLIQADLHFNAFFSCPKLCPRKQLQTDDHSGGVHKLQLLNFNLLNNHIERFEDLTTAPCMAGRSSSTLPNSAPGQCQPETLS